MGGDKEGGEKMRVRLLHPPPTPPIKGGERRDKKIKKGGEG